MSFNLYMSSHYKITAQSAETVEYTDCISAEGKTAPTSVLDMTVKICSRMQLTLRNAEYSFIAIAPGPLRPGVIAPDWVLSMCQIELKSALIVS